MLRVCPRAWMLKTYDLFQPGDIPTMQIPCFASALVNGLAGVVSTNANAQYLDGPPSFDKNEGDLGL